MIALRQFANQYGLASKLNLASQQADGLLAVWPLGDGAGNRVADAFGQRHGTVVGGPLWKMTSVGNVLSFNGSSNYVSVPEVPGVMSISYWIKTNSQANGTMMLDFSHYISDNAVPDGFENACVYVDGKPVSLYGDSILANGNMESVSNWVNNNLEVSSWGRSSEQAHGGQYSYKIVTTSGWAGIRAPVSVQSGTTYKASAWFYKVSGVADFMNFGGIDGGGASSVAAVGVPNTNNGVWQYISTYGTPATSGTLYFFLRSNNGASTFYTDDAAFVPVNIRYPITDTTSWHHVVVTTTSPIYANAITFGKNRSVFFSGSLADVRLYKKALSGADVIGMYSRPWDLYARPPLMVPCSAISLGPPFWIGGQRVSRLMLGGNEVSGAAIGSSRLW